MRDTSENRDAINAILMQPDYVIMFINDSQYFNGVRSAKIRSRTGSSNNHQNSSGNKNQE